MNTDNTQPKILPCPNPECRKRCEAHYDDALSAEGEPTTYQVWCEGTRFFDRCGYKGPKVHNKEESIKLHNAICAGPNREHK